jgi:hypothetical protein
MASKRRKPRDRMEDQRPRTSESPSSKEARQEAPAGPPILDRLFAIDQRSLSAFRIAIAILLLVDLGIRATDMGAMYSDDGMFSRARICRHYTSFWNWSFHFASGSWWYQAGLFGLAAAFALALLVGFRTRLAAAASWLLLVSLHNRVPPILSGADNLLRMLLFWGMFLPLGGAWSVDAWLARRRGIEAPRAQRVLSIASAAILLQMAFVYLFSAAFKSNATWLHGEAIPAILRYSFYARPVGSGLLEVPALLSALTVGVLVLEWSGPILLFAPRWTGPVRLLIVALLAGMHVGIGLLMRIGLFSVVSLSGLILFLPSLFWDKVPGFSRRSADGPSPAGTREEIIAEPALPAAVFTARVICALALLFVFFENLNGLPAHLLPWERVPKNAFAGIACGLGQKWDMFANRPPRDGWYVARAALAGGREVDLLRGGAPVSWDRPADPAAVYPDQHWLKIFREMTYTDAGYQVFREPVCDYLCRAWNRGRAAEERISDFTLVFCLQGEDGARPGSPVQRAAMVHLEFAPPPEG